VPGPGYQNRPSPSPSPSASSSASPRFAAARRISRAAYGSAPAWVVAVAFACALEATWHPRVEPRYWPWHSSLGSLSDLGPDAQVVTVLLLAAPVGLCLRLPLHVLGVLTVEYVAGSVFGLRPTAMPLGLAALVFVIGATRSRTVGLVASVAALLGCAVQDWVADGDPLAAGKSGNVLLLFVIAFIGGVLVRERREHGRALREQVAARAVTAERLRIARELHDMVAHSVGIVAIQSGAARRVIDTQPERAKEALGVIESTSRETLAGLRHMLGALRRAEADREEAAPMPGLADLDRLAAHAAGAGVRVELRRCGEVRPLPPEVELSAYRIVQESVTNVVRHSGARDCRVDVEYGRAELIIEIVDDGRGGVEVEPPGLAAAPCASGTRTATATATAGTGAARAGAADPAAGRASPDHLGYGLVGMRERVSLLHGRFDAGPRPDGGFRVAAWLPA
jgi:signal transduction histidine kinase